MKITKKELREVLRETRNEHPFGWRLASITAYIYNGKIGTFTHYHGQGIYEFLMYKEKFGVISCDLTDLGVKGEFNLKDAVDIAYDRVNDMIEEYNEKNKE